jgi:endonuclease I
MGVLHAKRNPDREARSRMRTHALLLAVALLALAAPSSSRAQSAVLISEMCDPHLNYLTDRFIEIYNAGAVAADLTGWTLVAVGNGGDIFTWGLSGSIESGQALVAGDQTTTVPFPVAFPAEAWSNSNSLWNGKIGDGAKLRNAGGIVVDYAVVTGTAFENSDYVRNYGVVLPATTYDPAEWTATPVEYATDGTPGTHVTAPPVPGPAISNVATVPGAPLAGEEVDVFADVTDTLAPVTSVALLWGTSQFSLPNEITMSPVTGATYGTDSPVPGHGAGVTVYFKIQASNSLPGTSVSDVGSYSLPYVVSIAEVQGTGSSSPYNGYAVITHGVVTGSYGSYFTLQDGGGAWNGLWARGASAPSVGDSVTVRGMIRENDSVADAGNTLLTCAVVGSSSPGAELPAATSVSTGAVSSEAYEGVLVSVVGAVCTNPALGSGEWQVDDGSGPGRVDDLGYAFSPTLGTAYDIAGPVAYRDGNFKVEPRDAADVAWAGDGAAPVISLVYAASDTSLVVTFSEEVEESSAEDASHYDIGGLVVGGAVRDEAHPELALLFVSVMSPGGYTLVVDGVEDLYANVMDSVSYAFDFIDVSVPAGYYDSAEGLAGDDLRAALHEIVDDHTVLPYSYSWEAFYTTDDKPNGKVWDIYSDVPGGTPPYEYTFGVDQGGVGGVEGTGYNREHIWPASWSGGEILPKYSDLFTLYPTDNFVNNQRGNDAYGEVDFPTWTSLNGSRRGSCSYTGYSGIAFEPIDEYKGDLARAFFYVTVRYYTEDGGWATSAMTDGADILPWAVGMLLKWADEDPVSRKELERNATVYAMQHNRNPFVDRPEFADLMYQAAGVPQVPEPAFALHQNAPNPFNPSTTISFELPQPTDVRVEIFDLSGRLVSVVAEGELPAGEHEVVWAGLDADGRAVAAGVYFCALRAGGSEGRRKMVLLK